MEKVNIDNFVSNFGTHGSNDNYSLTDIIMRPKPFKTSNPKTHLTPDENLLSDKLNGNTLNLHTLLHLAPGIFNFGHCYSHGLHEGMWVKWIAKRELTCEWAIYMGHEDVPWKFIINGGQKIYTTSEIKKLVPCDYEAFQMYKR